MEKHGIHSDTIRVGEREFAVRRDFALARRLEEKFGPLADVLRDVEKMRLTMTSLADLYEAAIDYAGTGHWREQIEAHILHVGYPRALAPIANIITGLFIGDERLTAAIDAGQANGALDPRQAATLRGAT